MKRCAIIGGGISGLAAAYFLQKKTKDIEIHLYDAEPEPGGVIKTEEVEGCIVEAGPDSFLTQKQSAADLCREIGLGNQLIGSNDSLRKTFLFRDGKLRQIPEGFFLMIPTSFRPFVTTDLVSWAGKFAVVSDLFATPEKEDCTVADFIQRRFGTEILNYFAEPLLSGIYGADVNRLSMKNALPSLWELQKNGSLIRSILRSRRNASDISSVRQSVFTTLKTGMGTLIKALREKCHGIHWKLDRLVIEIEKKEGRWWIAREGYDVCLIATTVIPGIVTENGRRLGSLYSAFRKNSAIVTVFCFEGIQKEGFGWLVPATERRSVMACTYLNQKFPERAPANRLLTRLFIGGQEADDWIKEAMQKSGKKHSKN